MWDSTRTLPRVQSCLQQLSASCRGNKPAVVAGYVNNKWNNGPGARPEASFRNARACRWLDHRDYSGTQDSSGHFGERGDSVFRVHVDASLTTASSPGGPTPREHMAAPEPSPSTGASSRATFILASLGTGDHWNIRRHLGGISHRGRPHTVDQRRWGRLRVHQPRRAAHQLLLHPPPSSSSMRRSIAAPATSRWNRSIT